MTDTPESQVLFTGVKETFGDDALLSQRNTYVSGKLHGPSVIYEKNQLSLRLSYVMGILEGTGYAYDEDGNIKQEMPFLGGLLHGIVISYHLKQKISEISYVRGKQTGKMILYAPNAAVQGEIMFLDGKENGDHIIYDPQTGEIIRHASYVAGKLHGHLKTYLNGKLLTDEMYVDGVKVE